MISLYYAPDNASLIIRIILEELDLPYQAILVDRSTHAQNSAKYLELNPNGLIPVCIINEQPVFETAAIALSLADSHQRLHIAIDDERRPQFLKWLFYLSNSLHSDLRQRFYPKQYVGSDETLLSCFNDITLQRLSKRIDIMEAQYSAIDTLYLFGDKPCIVDIYLAVCMRWMQLYPAAFKGQITMLGYPAINAMAKDLQQRQAVTSACAKEGITGSFFTSPNYSKPPEGTAI